MIILQTFGPAMGLADPSPFVIKAMMLLKLAGLEYREERADVRKAPKQKLPVIIDDGVSVPDSTFIRFHIEKKYGFDFDAGLSDEQKGMAWAIEKMLEDHAYWTVVHNRWMIDQNFYAGPAHFFKIVPAIIRPIVTSIVRKKIRNNLYGHGMGRHNEDEIVRLACKDYDSLSAILGGKQYIMGDKPCGADATVYAFISTGLCPVFASRAREHLESRSNLVDYAARMKAQYFPVA